MAEAQDRLFRKVALERLSSPDQLDKLVTIADGRAWIALAGLVAVLAVALGWGVLGRVPTSVPAKGILVAEGGRVLAAMSPAGGTVEKVRVQPGQMVRKGDVVASIRQSETAQRLAHALSTAAERERDWQRGVAQTRRELDLKLKTLRQREAALRQALASAQARVTYLGKQLASRQEMLGMGFATAERLQQAQDELSRAQREVADTQAQLIALGADAAAAQSAADAESSRLESGYLEARRHADELRTSLGESAVVSAPGDGRVTEVKATEGAIVAIGQPLVAIETSGGGLQAVVYIPTEHGKKVMAGMAARIAPAPVKKEEYGMVKAVVSQISAFPATMQGMAAVVQNDGLVQSYAKGGAPYEARIDLTAADTVSGYAWTSGRGAPVVLTTGTTVEAAITVREQRPIELVLPFLRRTFGLD